MTLPAALTRSALPPLKPAEEGWQILDVGSIWMREFGSAFCAQFTATAWCPEMMKTGLFRHWQRVERVEDPPLEIRYFPLQRGYSRPLLNKLVRYERKLLQRLLANCGDASHSPLICTTPFYAPLAELWPGPVVYYSTDLTRAYEGLNPKQVDSLDRRMCAVAKAVCPNSARIAAYLIEKAGCDAAKITVIPNATRESNVSATPLQSPGALPEDLRDLPRPIAGVMGHLGGNMDWVVIADAVRRTPEFSWAFVGPWNTPITDEAQSEARSWTMGHARFTGGKSYGELQEYARCFDVALLPYMRKEPTYSGSSTRFYEHLAACRPMIATRGFAELLEKEPLLELVDTGEEMAAALKRLREKGFSDGHEVERWEASTGGTWEERARALHGVIADSLAEWVVVKAKTSEGISTTL